jgi:CHAD domain-containing protein
MPAPRTEQFLNIVDEPVSDPGSVVDALGLRAVKVAETTFSEVFLDTYDGRLWRSGWRLTLSQECRSRTLRWWHVTYGNAGRVAVRKCPRWSDDLPAQCAAIAATIQMRMLTDVARWQGDVRRFALVDGREKTRVRVDLVAGAIDTVGQNFAAVALPLLWRTSPLKGFAADAEGVLAQLDSLHGANRCGDVLSWLSRHGDLELGGYSAKLDLELSPQMSIHAAICQLLALTHATVCATQAGTVADLDSEFLHDFRVAVRRARSWLARLKHWLDPELFAHLKAELDWLGSVTGPTRDLDVYLLKMSGYAASLPQHDAAALAPLGALLRHSKKREQRKLRVHLESARHAALLESWAKFSLAPPAPVAKEAAGAVASSVISRQWKRVCKRGRAIGETTPAEALHDLRIECKKLRYLLEAFASFYKRDAMAVLLRGLKRLQDNLGEFQDLEVQQDALRQFAHTLGKRTTAPETLVAIGRLVEKLARLQAAQRERFAKRWLQFDSNANNRLVKRAFAIRSPRQGAIATDGPG